MGQPGFAWCLRRLCGMMSGICPVVFEQTYIYRAEIVKNVGFDFKLLLQVI
jgi:hypothetical protein